jgi:hypothetical protein
MAKRATSPAAGHREAVERPQTTRADTLSALATPRSTAGVSAVAAQV